MRNPINLPDRAPPQFYSHAIEVTAPGRTLFVSGQVAIRPDGTVPETIQEQAEQVIQNMTNILAQARMTIRDVVKYTIYLTDAAHQPGFVSVAQGLLSAPPPAITLLIVKALADPKYLIEIEAIAVAP